MRATAIVQLILAAISAIAAVVAVGVLLRRPVPVPPPPVPVVAAPVSPAPAIEAPSAPVSGIDAGRCRAEALRAESRQRYEEAKATRRDPTTPLSIPPECETRLDPDVTKESPSPSVSPDDVRPGEPITKEATP